MDDNPTPPPPAANTAVELLRSIDESLKRLVAAAERKVERQNQWVKKQGSRANGPCRACHMRDRCTMSCTDKADFERKNEP